ncbi:transposon-encoded TnpW family protein [Dehalobacterium formicoaceticum]|uniref:transposon-encoded TnpW family protein n=1 Tax=Dehalobacterium formicoaceticum TaxID=51515 RepID=UPI00220217E5|nr:transposon-encoded TnpW family protein [Clostridiaceae bacterium HFYG-1003]
MNTENTITTTTQAEQPALVKQIGKTTYKVKVHFSETSKETMSDKIVRMLKSEISNMQSLQ